MFTEPIAPEIDIDAFRLGRGNHKPGDNAACLMELVSWIAGEPWSDQPLCVSPLLAGFARSFNDALDDKSRQRLKAFAWRMIGTADDGRDRERAVMAAFWVKRVQGPTRCPELRHGSTAVMLGLAHGRFRLERILIPDGDDVVLTTGAEVHESLIDLLDRMIDAKPD